MRLGRYGCIVLGLYPHHAPTPVTPALTLVYEEPPSCQTLLLLRLRLVLRQAATSLTTKTTAPSTRMLMEMRLKSLVESPNMTSNPSPKTAMDSPIALPLRGNFEVRRSIVVISAILPKMTVYPKLSNGKKLISRKYAG